jgi:hypothetical protein
MGRTACAPSSMAMNYDDILRPIGDWTLRPPGGARNTYDCNRQAVQLLG